MSRKDLKTFSISQTKLRRENHQRLPQQAPQQKGENFQ